MTDQQQVQGRSIWATIRAPLFHLDAEFVHEAVIRLVQFNAALGGGPNRLLSGKFRGALPESSQLPQFFGKPILSRVGLAAGFDKNAKILKHLPDLGFGFAEIGTVTPRPQKGNERPRLFRDPQAEALMNRMGFNNDGAERVAARVAQAKASLPAEFRVGLNIGKNRDTPEEKAAQDYRSAVEPFKELVDFIVINVSSPNTPGLRSLQNVESLKPIVAEVVSQIQSWVRVPRVLLKLAPELQGDPVFIEILNEVPQWGVEGWVLCNTLAHKYLEKPCGLSGRPLTALSRAMLKEARVHTQLPIISVGGIDSPDEAASRLSLGADLIEIYTGWIYKGPRLPLEISRGLSRL
jgi:dihydroorotate dehydrogenase